MTPLSADPWCLGTALALHTGDRRDSHLCADLTDESADSQRGSCQNHTGYRPFLYDAGICVFATTVNSPQSISKFQTCAPKIVEDTKVEINFFLNN